MEIFLSSNFRLSEFLRSETATKYGIHSNSIISFDIVNNLHDLVVNVLQPLRDTIGIPIHINSGFRCQALNDRINGSKSSQHLYGQASDITCRDNLKALKVLQTMDFDQLIVYGTVLSPRFIHVSYNSGNNRHQFLKYP